MKQRKTYKRQGIIGIKYPDDKYYHKIYVTTDVINRKANLKRQYTNCEITVFKDFENKVTKKTLNTLKQQFEEEYCKPVDELEYNDRDVNYLNKLVKNKNKNTILQYLSKCIAFNPTNNKPTYHNIYYNRRYNKFYKLIFDKHHKPITSDIYYYENGEELSVIQVVSIVKNIRNLKRRYTQMKNYNNKNNNVNKSIIVTGSNNNIITNNFCSAENGLTDKLLTALSELLGYPMITVRKTFEDIEESKIRTYMRDLLTQHNLKNLTEKNS